MTDQEWDNVCTWGQKRNILGFGVCTLVSIYVACLKAYQWDLVGFVLIGTAGLFAGLGTACSVYSYQLVKREESQNHPNPDDVG